MRRRKEGKVSPPLTLRHVPPEAYLLAYEQALLRFPGVRGWGREESPRRACSQDTYLQFIHIQVYYCSQMFSFRREPCAKNAKGFYNFVSKTFPLHQRRRRRRQREWPKSNRFRLAKQQLCTCITLFCTFLCLRRETSQFQVSWSREDKTAIFLFFPLNFNTVLQNSTRENFTSICRIEQDGKSSVNFEAARIFFREVFVDAALAPLKKM